jgi:anti-anti-sigma factor
VTAAGDQGAPAVLELEGEFDLDTVPEIDRFLRRALGPLYHQDHLVIDLAATTFVDSSFIAFIVRLAASLRTRRRELLLVRPRGQVRRVFGIVGLANVVPVFESVDAARESLRAGEVAVIPPAFRPAGA